MRIVDFVTSPDLWEDPSPWAGFAPVAPWERNLSAEELRDQYGKRYRIDLKARPDVDMGAVRDAIERAYAQAGSDFGDQLAADLSYLVCPMSETSSFVREKMRGVSGAAARGGVILYLNPPAGTDWQRDVYRMALHETNHTVRFRTSNPYDSFLDWVVSEGMAERYVSDLCPGEPDSPWAVTAPLAGLRERIDLYRSFWRGWDAPQGNASDWFFGSTELGVPLWAGYALGFAILSSYRRSNEALAWSELISLPSATFAEVAF